MVRLLLDNDLVDELTLLTAPVVVGQGRRLFPDTGQDLALELVESRHRQRGDDAGLPYGRAPAVRVGQARHDARDIDTPSRGRTTADRTGFGRVYGAPSSYSPTFGEGSPKFGHKRAGVSFGGVPDPDLYPTPF